MNDKPERLEPITVQLQEALNRAEQLAQQLDDALAYLDYVQWIAENTTETNEHE